MRIKIELTPKRKFEIKFRIKKPRKTNRFVVNEEDLIITPPKANNNEETMSDKKTEE